MSPFLIIFVIAIFFAPGFYATAQSADGSSAPDPSTGAADAGTASAQSEVPVRAEPAASTPASATSAPTQAQSTPPATPRAVPTQTVTPAATAPVTPRATPPAPSPTASVTPIPIAQPAATENDNTPLVVALGAVALALLGGFAALRSKKTNKDGDPCAALKKDLDKTKWEYEKAEKQFSLQELLLAELKRKIENLGGMVEDKTKEKITDVVHEIKDEVLEAEKSGKLKEAVQVGEEMKKTYDELVEKYEAAKKLLDALEKAKMLLAGEMTRQEIAYNACCQSASAAKALATPGQEFDLLLLGGKKLKGTIVENRLNGKK